MRVSTRRTSGRPRWHASYTASDVPTFCTTTPTSIGSPPEGTARRVSASMSCFSAPCGYLTSSGTTVMSAPAGIAPFIAATASILFASMPTSPFLHPRARMMRRSPPSTSDGFSSMRRWSAVSHGSHSAPFSTTVSMGFDSGGDSLTCVGNAAPPRPAMPASRTMRRMSSGESEPASPAGRTDSCHSSVPSPSMTMAGCSLPRGCGKRPMAVTLPEIGA